MLKAILILLVVAVGGVLAFAATKPDTFHVERSAHIKATPDTLFPLIADLRAMQVWSPCMMQLFFDMDAMVGRDFEAGLAELKALAEAPGARR